MENGEFSLSDLMHKHLLSEKFEASEVDPLKERKFYLSDMGKCSRVRWVKRHGVTSEFSDFVYWTFKIGDLYHDYGYKVLEGKGILLSTEDYVKTEHFVGRYDAIIKIDEARKAVLDLKSTNGFKLKKIIDGADDEQYIAQVLSYLMLLRDAGKTDLTEAIILYINKDPGDRIPYTFFDRTYHLTNWREKQLREEMNTLVDHWVSKTVPPCTCPGWMRDYNTYLPFCSMNEHQVSETMKLLEDGCQLVSTKSQLFKIKDSERSCIYPA